MHADTRPSSEHESCAVQEGLKSPGVKEVYGQFQDLEHNDPKWHKAGDIRCGALPAPCHPMQPQGSMLNFADGNVMQRFKAGPSSRLHDVLSACQIF